MFDIHNIFLRNPSIFKIKACLEILNVSSFFAIVWWVFPKVSYSKYDYFGDKVRYKDWNFTINQILLVLLGVVYESVIILNQ